MTLRLSRTFSQLGYASCRADRPARKALLALGRIPSQRVLGVGAGRVRSSLLTSDVQLFDRPSAAWVLRGLWVVKRWWELGGDRSLPRG